MFVLKQDNSFTWQVDVKVPQDKKWDKQRFHCTFKVMSKTQLQELTGDDPVAADQALFHDVVVDWSDVKGEDGEDLPFTAENLDRMLDIPYVRLAIAEAYFSAILSDRRPAKN